MKKLMLFFVVSAVVSKTYTQELFLFTEPASNMATNNLGIRLAASAMNKKDGSGLNFHLMPELMYGINNKFMIHATSFLSNRSRSLVSEGGSLYFKYKFFNNDDVQRHFRVAAYGRYSFNNADIHQEEINLYGHNTGYEAGIVATQLLHKVAISSSISYSKALDNSSNNKFPSIQSNEATNYTISIGKLMLPKKYKDYAQTNLNIMCEFLGEILTPNGKSFLDIAPTVQLIIKSKMRIDIGYRKELYSNMLRTAPNGFLLRLEYNFFNAF